MNNESKKIYVFENWSSDTPRRIGFLYADNVKGKEHFSFEYDEQFLESDNDRFVLDPDIAFVKGRQLFK